MARRPMHARLPTPAQQGRGGQAALLALIQAALRAGGVWGAGRRAAAATAAASSYHRPRAPPPVTRRGLPFARFTCCKNVGRRSDTEAGIRQITRAAGPGPPGGRPHRPTPGSGLTNMPIQLRSASRTSPIKPHVTAAAGGACGRKRVAATSAGSPARLGKTRPGQPKNGRRWTDEALMAALAEAALPKKQRRSLAAIAEAFNIPVSTLKDYVSGQVKVRHARLLNPCAVHAHARRRLTGRCPYPNLVPQTLCAKPCTCRWAPREALLPP